MNTQIEETASTSPQVRANDWANKYGITANFQFVPFSLSRCSGDKHPSLNWKVTLYKDKREFLRFDYMQGCGHAPSYKQRMVAHDVRMLAHECEKGFRAREVAGSFYNSKKIEPPKLADVLYSISSDADAIDYSTFEDWAASFGYETDSRKAETSYKTCLEYALKLRGAVGQKGLNELQKAVADM